jgi:RNA polymerase sigma-70 factor, ECF subfamily
MSASVETIVARARAGDRAAGSELVSLLHERIYAYLRRLCGEDEEAADLTQKTFCQVWSGLPSYAGRSSVTTWVHGIAYHVYVDWRRRQPPSEWRAEEWWEVRAVPGPDPSEEAAQRDLARQLYAWVDQLPDEVRQAVHLHYYQGLSLAETAEVLDVASSTVKNRLRQAVEALRARAASPRDMLHQP